MNEHFKWKFFAPLLIFFLSTPSFAKQFQCQIVESSGLCIVSAQNAAACLTAAVCGDNCPSPPLPGSAYSLVASVVIVNVCSETAVATAATGSSVSDVFSTGKVEGVYTGMRFYSISEIQYCDGTVFSTSTNNGCSDCQTISTSAPCHDEGVFGASCSSNATCLPGTCPESYVGITSMVTNDCPDPFSVYCTADASAGYLGVSSEAACTSVFTGLELVSTAGYWFCDGSFNSYSQAQPCPQW